MTEVIFHLLTVVAPIAAIVLLGLALAKLKVPFDHAVVRTIALNVGFPCLIVQHLSAGHVGVRDFLTMFAATVAFLLALQVASLIFLTIFRLPIRAYASPLSFINIGNLGIPVVSLAVGTQGMSFAFAAFAALLISLFTIGEAIVRGRASLISLVTSPVIYGVIVGLVLLITGAKVPQPIDDTLKILGGLPIPLMLLTLGHTLATLQFGDLGRASILSVVHLAMALSLGVATATLFGLTGTERSVFIIMAAMPVGIITYLFVEHHAPDYARPVAGLVLTSNLLTIIALPFVLTYLV